MTPICFVDTETTSLRLDRRVWEVAIIRRDDTGTKEYLCQIHDVDLSQADPKSLQIGRFFERHLASRYGPSERCFREECRNEYEVAREVEYITRESHIVGAVPDFDTWGLGDMLRRNGLCPSWHYHLCDVENLAVGYIRGLQKAGGLHRNYDTNPPWNSDELSQVLEIEPASPVERHTAMGDAKWAMRIYDKILGQE